MIKINLEKIPHKGFILATFESGVIFEPYEVKGDEIIFRSMKTLQEVIPTELHLFDQETEFRIVQRESRGDQIELLMTKEQELEMDSDLIYVEETFIKPEYSRRSCNGYLFQRNFLGFNGTLKNFSHKKKLDGLKIARLFSCR